MRTTLLALIALILGASVAQADPSNLAYGTLFAHHVPELPYSSDPPPGTGDWCQEYELYAVYATQDVNARIDVTGYAPVVWYVLAAWYGEDKEWCGTEFGLGDFYGPAFSFAEAFPCFPDEGLEIPTANWPGPLEGTAFVTTTQSWFGNWVPVYFFGGYAYDYYGAQVIPIAEDPPTGFVGFGNCMAPPQQFDVAPGQLGKLGINTDGYVPGMILPPIPEACCFPDGHCELLGEVDCIDSGGVFYGGPCDPNPCPQPEGACCVIGNCSILTQEECALVGGEWLGMGTSCDPNPCPAVCCIDATTQYHTCIITLEDECAAQGGYWHPEEGSCDPNPCTIYTASQPTSWGEIRNMYQ